MTQTRQLWDAKALESAPRPKVSFHSFEQAAGRPKESMTALMSHLHERGFCFIDRTPPGPEASKWMLQQIGPIRETHYGGFYDFVPDLSSADTAYTNLALDPHTDTTYFTDPAGLQSFHMLSHTPPPGHKGGGKELGGKSILVDGFMVAEKMRELHPEDFETLRRVPIAWHASGNRDAPIIPDRRYPVIETAGDGPSAEIRRIRWNNDDRGLVPLEDAEKWYEAARKWAAMVKSPEYQYLFQLEPGRMLVFDNWRLLHGRTAFEGLRRICGAYINRDDFHARWQLTRPFKYYGQLASCNLTQDYPTIAAQPISFDLENVN
ncbi:Trimethyllysine dioxygenase-like protein [Hapsidospora chrysogenum ATCC 11550]|uniref:Trimethyllysine dioxygenase-like protein n=1 Tax=Hapsidospora chrysogenum (strain ATCC 11550 / CBS 779.69 / DSM 880 / IAM 14645 / JCM 23072 / IMI 49137) TaxID=857340 RepID=A0A086TB90_HAPC1|nr:Trimethyllysine dioxygenase-like protein [Hapsidospora chrysogenum ATCC 11550]